MQNSLPKNPSRPRLTDRPCSNWTGENIITYIVLLLQGASGVSIHHNKGFEFFLPDKGVQLLFH
jgi:hypothetical protein